MIRSVVAADRRQPNGTDRLHPPGDASLIEVRPPAGVWTVEESFRYCERIARGQHENFPIASRFVPAELRQYVWAIYAFARAADDFADEARYEGRRSELLEHWESELERCYYGEAEHPIFIALRETAEKRDIPILPLRDLITAFRIDLSLDRHPTFASLHNYCVHSAEALGQLVLYVFDYREPALHRFTNDLATALQLTKFVQDVGPDLARGRIYLPLEDLTHFGVSEEDLQAGRATADFRALIRYQVARTRAFFERGRPIIDKVGRDLSFEMSLMWHGGTTILSKIEAIDYDVFHHRPTLDTVDKMRMVMKSAVHRWPERGSRDKR